MNVVMPRTLGPAAPIASKHCGGVRKAHGMDYRNPIGLLRGNGRIVQGALVISCLPSRALHAAARQVAGRSIADWGVAGIL